MKCASKNCKRKAFVTCRCCDRMFCNHCTGNTVDHGRPRGKITGLPVGPYSGVCFECKLSNTPILPKWAAIMAEYGKREN